MAEHDRDLEAALARVRSVLLDDQRLVRAVAAGRRRGHPQPTWRRAELRYVDLKAGRRLQVTTYNQTQAFTANHEPASAPAAVDTLLAEPFGNWHLFTVDGELALRVTKKGDALVHSTQRADAAPDATPATHSHDRPKQRVLPEDDPVLRELGIADAQGRVKPSRQAKYRQVEEFLRALDAALDDAVAAGSLRTPTADDPWLLVDLGCGNAYLTFAAHRHLTAVRRQPARVVGVDAKDQSLAHNEDVARRLGVEGEVVFVRGLIGEVDLRALAPAQWPEAEPRRAPEEAPGRAPEAEPRRAPEEAPGRAPDVVLALHACDTATDDALAAAVQAGTPLVLAAPCCHHDVAAQLRGTGRGADGPSGAEDASSSVPAAYSLQPALLRDGILRERFADTLTDAMRASVLRAEGYRVDVMEFVESRHTPRNTLLRGVRTGARPASSARAELEQLTDAWRVRPRLLELLDRWERAS